MKTAKDFLKGDCNHFSFLGKDACSWLHYDGGGGANLNAQVTGKKKVYLFDPDQAKRLYMFYALNGEPYNFSQVNFLEPNPGKFPLYDSSCALVGDLEPGDIIYIPPYWLHAFEHIGDLNINVNFWWEVKKVKLNPLSAREDYVHRCQSAYDLGDRLNYEKYLKFHKLLAENTSIKDILINVEKSFLS